jgi:hypothetical protein
MTAMETSLTIEGIDADTFERLNQEANRLGVAVPVLARTLLEQSINASVGIYHDLDPLMGTWSEEEAAAFDAITGEMRGIDPELWR